MNLKLNTGVNDISTIYGYFLFKFSCINLSTNANAAEHNRRKLKRFSTFLDDMGVKEVIELSKRNLFSLHYFYKLLRS